MNIGAPSSFNNLIGGGASLEAGNIHSRFDGFPAKGTIFSGSVFLGAETFAGPAYFGFGAGESGRYSVYLLLGVP